MWLTQSPCYAPLTYTALNTALVVVDGVEDWTDWLVVARWGNLPPAKMQSHLSFVGVYGTREKTTMLWRSSGVMRSQLKVPPCSALSKSPFDDISCSLGAADDHGPMWLAVIGA